MVKGGFGEMVAIAAAEDKTKLFDFSFDLTKATVWGFLFLVLFDVVLTFPKDQVLMQRVLSTESAKEAGPLGVDVRGHHDSRRLHVLHGRHRAVCVLQDAPGTPEPVAAHRFDLPAVHRG